MDANSTKDNNINSVIIIGGGLVGSLCACFMAKRGYHVTVYEQREDMRLSKAQQGRSINLALSNRGRRALKAVELEEVILKAAIPMKGRLLHSLSGKTKPVLYDIKNNQCIYSIGRNYLNQTLLNAMEKYPNVKLCFSHKLLNSNLQEGNISIINLKTEETFTDKADLIIGADGAFSCLRRAIQQTPLFHFSQTYIDHGYMELSIPSELGNEMAPNYLHIWPRNQFMMIALPNQDNSWTVTIFMPFKKFDELNSEGKVLEFFKLTFPDAVRLIGQENIVNGLLKLKPSPLISVKCNPYHLFDKFLIIGDAAHAMVPFYGQGMNAGFEDCLLLSKILDLHNDNISLSLQDFTDRRVNDAHTICDLAMYNYLEMRDLVTKPSYYLRRIFDNLLFRYVTDKWIPLYNSVTFSEMGYKQCLDNVKWQDEVIYKGICIIIALLALASFYLVFM